LRRLTVYKCRGGIPRDAGSIAGAGGLIIIEHGIH